jgi:hypothetical protein
MNDRKMGGSSQCVARSQDRVARFCWPSGRIPGLGLASAHHRLFQVCSKRFHVSRHWNQEYIIFNTPIWILVSIIFNSHSLFKFMYLVQQNKRFFVPHFNRAPSQSSKARIASQFHLRSRISLVSYRVISRSSFADRPCSVVLILVSKSESLHKSLSYTLYRSPAQERTWEELLQPLRSGVCLIASYTSLKHISDY